MSRLVGGRPVSGRPCCVVGLASSVGPRGIGIGSWSVSLHFVASTTFRVYCLLIIMLNRIICLFLTTWIRIFVLG